MLSETLKALRRQAQLSQEQLAASLHVSRQAVTKWETGAGTPDIENLRAISALFQVSLDELLENRTAERRPDFLYQSATSYDIDCEKDYDITFAGAKQVTVTGYAGEQLQVRLGSDRLPALQTACKVRIDDVKRKIDVDVRRTDGLTEAAAKEALHILVRLPQSYVRRVELAGSAETLELLDLEAANLEFSGKASVIRLDRVIGPVELDTNRDLDIRCGGLHGRLDLNQLSATSRLTLPPEARFCTVVKGRSNRILFERDGRAAEDLSLRGAAAADCENVIELNGMKSELVVNVAGPAAEA